MNWPVFPKKEKEHAPFIVKNMPIKGFFFLVSIVTRTLGLALPNFPRPFVVVWWWVVLMMSDDVINKWLLLSYFCIFNEISLCWEKVGQMA